MGKRADRTDSLTKNSAWVSIPSKSKLFSGLLLDACKIDRWSNFSLFLFLFIFIFIFLFCLPRSLARSLTVGKRNDVMQGTGEDGESRIVLAKPMTLNGESDVDYTAPNPLQLVLSLFKNVLPGSDLSRFQASHNSPSYSRDLFVIFLHIT